MLKIPKGPTNSQRRIGSLFEWKRREMIMHPTITKERRIINLNPSTHPSWKVSGAIDAPREEALLKAISAKRGNISATPPAEMPNTKRNSLREAL